MKKQIILVLLLMMPFLMMSQTFSFNVNGNYEGWKVNNAIGNVTDGVLRIVPTNSRNPNIRFRKGIDAKEAKYCHIKIRNYSSSANTIRFYFPRTTDSNRDFFVNAVMETNSPKFVIITLPTDAKKTTSELTDLDGWEGIVKELTLRFTDRKTKLNEMDLIEIDQIVFDNNPTLK
tara:strand:+ start:16133 stop:16657 length:525 start_codon:yes stop_codon:yes gene_type:complete